VTEFANEKYKQSEGKLCIRPLKVNKYAISTSSLRQKKCEFFFHKSFLFENTREIFLHGPVLCPEQLS